jgi:hypothetical protein
MLIFRIFVAALVGLVAGGSSAYALSLLLTYTPLSMALGLRHTEFNGIAVFGVTLFGAGVSCLAAALLAVRAVHHLRAGTSHWPSAVFIATLAVILLMLTLVVDGQWAWLGMFYLAVCLGTISGISVSLLITGESKQCINKQPN